MERTPPALPSPGTTLHHGTAEKFVTKAFNAIKTKYIHLTHTGISYTILKVPV